MSTMPFMTTTKSEQEWGALPAPARLKLLRQVYEILEYDDNGHPGGEWSSDTTQALGEAFNAVGVTFTEPGAHEWHDCDECGETYDETTGDGYCGLCPACADALDAEEDEED